MSIANILDKAAVILEPEGVWVQGHWRQSLGRLKCFCAEGAIMEAASVRGGAVCHAVNFFGNMLPDPPEHKRRIPWWNDRPERTQPEVVAKLREAAAKAREQGL